MAIAHEIKHKWDAIFTPAGAGIDAEGSAMIFMFFIWEFNNTNFKVGEDYYE